MRHMTFNVVDPTSNCEKHKSCCRFCFNARVYGPTEEEMMDPFITELTDENDSSSCGVGEMNNDQLEYFLVNPETRNLLQIEFPSDINEFNKILGTSAGKNELLKMLGIVEEGY